MENKPSPRRVRAGDVVKLAVVVACLVGGVILRFQDMPAKVVGGGLLILGCGLLAYWARAGAKR